MTVSLHAQAELELVEGAAYYTREASAEIAIAFISEFERSAKCSVNSRSWVVSGGVAFVAYRCGASLTASSTICAIQKYASLRSRTNGVGPGFGGGAHEP